MKIEKLGPHYEMIRRKNYSVWLCPGGIYVRPYHPTKVSVGSDDYIEIELFIPKKKKAR